MNYDLNESQLMLQKAARDFFTKECPKNIIKDIAKDDTGYPKELWHKMADLGWLGLIFPEKYGGTGGNFIDLVVLLEEMGRACLPGPYFSTVVSGGTVVLEAGNDDQKKRLLTGIAEGKVQVTLALTEPDRNQFSEEITLEATAKGDKYVINGIKLFVPYAHTADFIVCAANTSEGPTMFLVEKTDPSISCTLLKTLDDDKQCEVVFNKTTLSKDQVLGAVGKGRAPLRKVIDRATVAKCAEMVGGAQKVLEMTIDHVKQRVQFGRHVGSFQAVQHHCANMLMLTDTSRLLTYKAAWKLSEDMSCQKEVATAKAWVSDACKKVTMLGHQCIGGVGFMEDHDLPLYSKRTKVSESAFGDADYNREIVAEMMKL
jgi:3-oxocholest-4-en-26-oyl-CoA dehydrogenase beta subunit